MQPTIGITFNPNKPITHKNNYIKTIKEFKAIPLPLTTESSDIKDVHGILLTGGGDIDPSHYNQDPSPMLLNVNTARDIFELMLCEKALSEKIPILGICRGLQIMAITDGGDLYQDLALEYPKKIHHSHARNNKTDAEHHIEIFRGSKLNQIIGRRISKVNSAHHQSVKDQGRHFKISAQTSDGIIEAIEHRHNEFALGVQYHPERMIETNAFQIHREKLFRAFIGAALKKCSVI